MNEEALIIPVLGIVFGGVIVVVSILSSMVRQISTSRQREQTRREVAAYVAEGSMTADEGERLLRAGDTPSKA